MPRKECEAGGMFSAALPTDTLPHQQLGERKKRQFVVPCTGVTKVPGWAPKQNHPM
jgi:hypothetical protein